MILTLLTTAYQPTLPTIFFLRMEDLSSLEIWFGISNLESLKYIERKVQSIYVHPKFNDKNKFWNDICLLRLDRPISYQYNIQPICLPCQVEGNLIYGSFSYETFFFGGGVVCFSNPTFPPWSPIGLFPCTPSNTLSSTAPNGVTRGMSLKHTSPPPCYPR